MVFVVSDRIELYVETANHITVPTAGRLFSQSFANQKSRDSHIYIYIVSHDAIGGIKVVARLLPLRD
jgi:soluble P-type ATPase